MTRRDYRFFGHRYVAGSRRNYRDHSLAVELAIALQHDCPGYLFIFHSGTVRAADNFFHRSELRFRSPGGEDVIPMLRQPLEDRCYLRRRFSFSENHFRHPDPECAVMIHFCKTQVFKGKMSKLLDGVVGRESAGAHLLKKFTNGFGVQSGSQFNGS